MALKKILLIDDESVMTDSIQDMLENLRKNRKIGGYDVHSAHNFYEALEHLGNNSYDLLITDLLMPTYGLPPELQEQRGVVLSGWTFLYHYVLEPTGEYYEKNRRAKCIVFSAYLDRLSKHWEDTDFHQEAYKERLSLIDKGNIFDDSGGFDKLIDTIADLLK